MDKFRLTECQTLDIPVGNDVPLLVKLVKGFDGCDGEGVVPFPIDVCENVVVTMVSERGQVKSVAHRLGTDGEVLLELQAGDFRAGLTYGIDVRATLNGKAVHAYGKSLVRITAATERGPRQVAQAADPYEVTLYVGYVGDVIPRRLDELEGYDDLMAEVGGKADAAEVNEALGAVGREFQKYIPVAHKAVAGGVASLNGDGKVPTAQAQFAMRGNLVAADIDSTALQSGFYRIIGQRLGADILGGDEANGVLIQYSDGYKEQVLMVGRTAGAAAGEQVETYTRRYLPTPKRWTAWYKAGGGGGGTSDDIYVVHIRPDGSNFTLVEPVQEVFAARDAGKTIIGIVEGERLGGVLNYLPYNDGPDMIPLACALQLNPSRMIYDVYTIYDGNGRIVKNSISFDLGKMTAAEAETGTAEVARTISASVLKQAIRYHTSDLVNGGAYNSTSKKIELKHGSTVVAEIDAAPFIVDGMVDDVRIENGNLVIDFNTESGKQDIAIPLTDIFNPNNYYTKQQTDGLLSMKAGTEEVGALQQQVAGKQDTIQDLAEIRSGAAAGATAVQPAALQPYATEQWVGEQGFLTQHQDISGKEDKMQVVAVPTGETSLAAQAGKYYKFADDLGTFDITLPVLTDVTTVQTIVFFMTMGSAPAVTFTATQPIYYHDGFSLEAGKTYEVSILWNGAAWVVASVEIVVN